LLFHGADFRRVPPANHTTSARDLGTVAKLGHRSTTFILKSLVFEACTRRHLQRKTWPWICCFAAVSRICHGAYLPTISAGVSLLPRARSGHRWIATITGYSLELWIIQIHEESRRPRQIEINPKTVSVFQLLFVVVTGPFSFAYRRLHSEPNRVKPVSLESRYFHLTQLVEVSRFGHPDSSFPML
jgi:hypothetical protein